MAGLTGADLVTITVEVERPFGRRFALPGEILEVTPEIAEEAIARGWARPGAHGDGRPRTRPLPPPRMKHPE